MDVAAVKKRHEGRGWRLGRMEGWEGKIAK
jgi:hypothetical protein